MPARLLGFKQKVAALTIIYPPKKQNWLVVSTPLKSMKVSWDYFSQYMENSQMFRTTNEMIVLNQNPLAFIDNFQVFSMLCPLKRDFHH